jgi:hypothetical protein
MLALLCLALLARRAAFPAERPKSDPAPAVNLPAHIIASEADLDKVIDRLSRPDSRMPAFKELRSGAVHLTETPAMIGQRGFPEHLNLLSGPIAPCCTPGR